MTIEVENLTSLINSTLFLMLSFESFGNFRKSEVEIKTDALKTRFRKQKQLLESPELKAIGHANAEIKAHIYNKCLPGSELDGMKIVPFKNVEYVAKTLKNYKNNILPALVEDLIAVYDDQVAQAKAELKDEFNPAHFLSKDAMRAAFAINYKFVTFDVPAKLGEISAMVFDEEREKQSQFLTSATEQVIQAMRAAAYTAVQKLSDGLSGELSAEGKPKKLFAAHITKLQEFIKDFNIMNSANDKELAGHVANLEKLMEGVNIDQVRENEGFREDLTSKIADIATKMSSLAEVSTGRKFRAPVTPAATTADVAAIMAAQTNLIPTPELAELLLPSDETLAAIMSGQN